MNKVILDADLKSKLQDLAEPLELCDESGRVLARVTPVFDPSEYELLTPDVSDEELQRRSESNEKRYTTAQVLDHLEKM